MRRRRSRRFPSSPKQPLSASPLPRPRCSGSRCGAPLIPEETETPKVPFWKKEILARRQEGRPQAEAAERKRRGASAKAQRQAPAVDEAPTMSVPAPGSRPSAGHRSRVAAASGRDGEGAVLEEGDRRQEGRPEAEREKERKPKASKEERAAETKEPKQPKERKQKAPKVKAARGVKGSEGDHRPEDRRIPARCSARLEQRQRRAPAGRARAARAGDRRRRRAARSRTLCRSTEGILREERTPEARRPARHRKQQDRRPHVRDHRDRRPEAARETRSASGPRRRCRFRSTRRCSTTRCSVRESTRRGTRLSGSCSSSPIAS